MTAFETSYYSLVVTVTHHRKLGMDGVKRKDGNGQYWAQDWPLYESYEWTLLEILVLSGFAVQRMV